jgi:hypothetical protein
MEKHILSKSTFIRGMQCEKSLYLNKYNKELKAQPDPSLEAIFTQGTQVGELAQKLFPGGVDCTPASVYDFQKAVLKTNEFINFGNPVIYEAAFQHNGVLAALDILVKDNEGWKAYEVKSSTAVTDTYILDASIQYYCIKNAGIDLVDISIIHINNQYIKQGELDINQLFTIESIKDQVLDKQSTIENDIDRLKNTLNQTNEPSKEIGIHCSSPYSCDFMHYCWKDIPEYSIFDISRLSIHKKFELYKKGILNFNQIPSDFPLNENQWKQVHGEIRNEKFINQLEIKDFIESFQFPIYFLDFETFTTAIPIIDNSRPYQQIVFQYSIHKLTNDYLLTNGEFLAESDGKDPRIPFIEKLINDCGDSGTILVYNIGFERGRLSELCDIFPKYKSQLSLLMDRMIDLMIPFQKKWYYTPEMKGSYSIKKVLPALIPNLTYSNLTIKEGGTASNTFASMMNNTFSGDIEQTRKDLLEYCKLDTYAMVEIFNLLKNC